MNWMENRISTMPSTARTTPPQTSPSGSTKLPARPTSGSVIMSMKSPMVSKMPASTPSPEPDSDGAIAVAVLPKKPVNISSVKKIRMAIRLKKSCTVAMEKPCWNCFLLPARPSATRVEVTEVPMFAPKSIGIAMFNGRPPAIMPTTIEVVVEED